MFKSKVNLWAHILMCAIVLFGMVTAVLFCLASDDSVTTVVMCILCIIGVAGLVKFFIDEEIQSKQ